MCGGAAKVGGSSLGSLERDSAVGRDKGWGEGNNLCSEDDRGRKRSPPSTLTGPKPRESEPHLSQIADLSYPTES